MATKRKIVGKYTTDIAGNLVPVKTADTTKRKVVGKFTTGENGRLIPDKVENAVDNNESYVVNNDWLKIKNSTYDSWDNFEKANQASVIDSVVSIGEGVGGLFEGVADLGAYLLSGGANLVGMKDAAKDIKNWAKDDQVGKLGKWARDTASDITGNNIEENSIYGNKTDSVFQGVGQVGGMIATGGIAGAAGAGAGTANAIVTGMNFASSTGRGMSEAYNEGASDKDAIHYGLMQGAIDTASEKLFGGLGKASGLMGFSKGFSALDDKVATALTSKIKSKVGKTLIQYGVKAGSEGSEEVIAGALSAVAKKMTYKSKEDLQELVKDEQLLDQFITGALVSGVAQGGDVVTSLASGRDFVTNLTANEQKVVDAEVESRVKELEKNNKKLTNKEKSKIIEAVQEDLKRGGISIDTIESALGGDTYNQFKSISDKEAALSEEIERLSKDPRASAQKRLVEAQNELKEITEGTTKTELKDKLSKEVSDITSKDTYLQESYNEKARRSQAYNADLSRYDDKQRSIIQKAIDSGILNNTNKTHDFVDLVAKLSADKGVSFDFTNNENLKKSGFAMEGKIINGLVKDGEIILNVESSKALNTIVGHEITHILEGTDLYTELQNTIIEYAKTKGDYQSRYDALAKLYEGVEGANVVNELTSDLVGDYLFTDEDFIKNLSTEQPNIFKKIYEEIKHLFKLATAGSKEARQLEQVKKAFDKAYKQGSSALSNVVKADTKKIIFSITKEMTEEEVTKEIEKMTIEPAKYNEETLKEYDNFKELESAIKSEAEKIIGPIADEMGVFKDYKNHEIELELNFSKNSMKESMHQQTNRNQDFSSFEKMLSCFDEVVANAKIINVHDDKYKGTIREDRNIKNVYVFLSAYRDGEYIVPVEFNVKELTNSNKIYMSVTLTKIKEADIVALPSELTEGDRASQLLNINVAQMLMLVNSSEGDFFKYIPNTLLNSDQQASKMEALKKEAEKIAALKSNIRRYSLSQDTKGRTLTKDQQEYFKDSKVVDDNGNLLVVYHGTRKADFTVFNRNHTYFTDSKEMADSYAPTGEKYEGYLNIKRPFVIDAQGERWSKIPVDKTTRDLLERYGGSVFKDGGKWRSTPADVVSAIEDGIEEGEFDYDGVIIKNVDDTGVYWEDSNKHLATDYIVFNSNQFKNIDNKTPTDNPDINLSLSNPNEDIAPVGNYNVYGRDIALAPVREDISSVQEVADDYAPLTEEMANERDAQLQNIDMLDGSYMPDEVEAPYYESNTEVDDPFEERDIKDVGNGKVNAYMYDNPDVKPFFQQEAKIMLTELQNSRKGEKSYNAQLYYDTNGELGWFGTKRETSDDIAYLLDNFKYKYDDIEKGLRAIIQDHGAENNAISKRIEFALNDRLKDGYTDFMTGEHISANQDYVNLLMEKQINSYSDDAYYEWVQTLANEEAPQPLESITDDIAPLREDIVPKVKENAEFEAIAQVLDAEPTTESTRNKRKWAIFKANILDKGSAFEDLSLKTGNRELMGKWNYTLYSESRAQRLIGSGDGNVKSLNAIREQVDNTGMTKQFYEYMYHKHNVDRMKLEERYDTENKPVFGESVTAEVSQEIVDKYEATQPKFMDYAQDVYDYQNYLRQQLVDNGVISQETADLWQEMYPHYVPVRRIDTTGYNINVPLDTRRTGINAPVKKAVGGSTDILPLFDTMAMRTLQTYKATAKNSFGVELKNTLNSTIESSEASVDDVIESVEAQETLLQKGKNGRKPTFTVFENGERVTFEITEDMYDALQPVSEALSKTIGIANKFGKIHRGVLTEFNPVFMLTNPIKDVQDILLNSQHAGKTYAKLAEALTQIKNKGYWYTEYMNNGGDQNSYFSSETNTFTEEKGKISNFLPFRAISTLNNYIETIPRLAEYIASREGGRSIEVSMLDSARVTTNFRAGGDVTKFLNRNGATFLNASVQGAMQQVRNFREAHAKGMKGWANLATKFAIAGIPALILNSLLWGDDEEYEELSDYVKQNYHIIGKDDNGNFIRIPKGRTVAVIQDAFKQMENAITGNDEVDLNSFLDLVVTNLAPTNPTENNILAPIGQVMTNTTWYGEDLVPERLQDLPDAEQYDETTDLFSVWLGQNLNVSPIKINYLLDQYTGGIGDMLLPMLTPAAETGDDSLVGNALAPIKGKFTTNSTTNNQNLTDIYDLSDKLTSNANSSKATDEDILMNKYINSIKGEMSELYKQKREIQNSNLKSSKKYEQVMKMQEQITELAKTGLNSYEGVNIEGSYATVGDRHFKKNADGEWEKITDKQLEKQNKVTSALDISASEYWSDKEWYDYSYESPEKAAIAKAVGGYEVYKPHAKALNAIKGDKDANGDTISGSRKTKVVEYINSIDADYGTKIILYKSTYPADDRYNRDIVEYLNSRDDISYSEMEEILKALGFTVSADGKVTW